MTQSLETQRRRPATLTRLTDLRGVVETPELRWEELPWPFGKLAEETLWARTQLAGSIAGLGGNCSRQSCDLRDERRMAQLRAMQPYLQRGEAREQTRRGDQGTASTELVRIEDSLLDEVGMICVATMDCADRPGIDSREDAKEPDSPSETSGLLAVGVVMKSVGEADGDGDGEEVVEDERQVGIGSEVGSLEGKQHPTALGTVTLMLGTFRMV